MTRADSAPHLLTLIFVTAVSVLSLNMFVPSLANMASEFGTPYSVMSIAIAGYLAATAVAQLLIGALSDRLGRRKVVLGIIAIFTVASTGCALVDDIRTFLFFRMLQSVIACGYALSLTIVHDTANECEAIGLISYISMAMALAPIFGPMLGGVLDASFGWRANFYLYAIAGTMLFVLCWHDLGETKTPNKESTAQSSKSMLGPLAEPRFFGYALCSAFSIGAFYAFIAGAPFIAQNVFGISTLTVGTYIGSITCGYLVGTAISAQLAKQWKPTTLMLAGRLIACAGLLVGLILLINDFTEVLHFFGATVFVGLGNGITTPSSSAGAISVCTKQGGSAAGISGALTVAVGAMVTLLTGYLLTEDNARLVLLGMMFSCSFLGLLATCWVIRLKEPLQKVAVSS